MKNKILSYSSLILLMGSFVSLTSCSSKNSDKVVLRVLNSEDYIYLNEDEPGTPEEETSNPDMIIQFEEYCKKELGINCEVVYDTADTNETIYSEMQTGKSNYDLICTSDYMLQKIISNDLAIPLNKEELPNYNKYASREIKSRLDNIETTLKSTNEVVRLEDYCVGYMWGTLGLLFNPNYDTYLSNNISFDEVIDDMRTYSSLWDKKYHGTFSIKDSMRDTYAVGLMETYKDELLALRIKYQNNEINASEFNKGISEIFNRCDKENIDEISTYLKDLKENSFGLECDSGKQDIVTGKIGINLAWSGDAVYSIDQAEDEEQVSNPFDLWYSVPENGSNIWLDCWLMPKLSASNQTEQQRYIAHKFLDFLSMPENVKQNMDYTGYTSFVGGDDILELTRDWYDIRTSYMYADEDSEMPVYYYNGDEKVEVDYDTFFLPTDISNPELFYEDENGVESPFKMEDDEGNEVALYYNDLVSLLSKDYIEEVDLTYFFDGTLDKYAPEDMIFYTDCYLPIYVEDEEGNLIHNVSCGRQFFCQYPNQETIVRCAVMRDYGDVNNKLIMKMWEDFKSDPLPNWSIILFAIEIASIVGIITLIIINKRQRIINSKRRTKTIK